MLVWDIRKILYSDDVNRNNLLNWNTVASEFSADWNLNSSVCVCVCVCVSLQLKVCDEASCIPDYVLPTWKKV